MRKILKYFYSQKSMVCYEHSLDNFSHEKNSSSNFQYRALKREDYDPMAELLFRQAREESVFQPVFDIHGAMDRINKGEHCFICAKGKCILGYIWFAPKQKYIKEIDATLYLNNSSIYIYNAYVRQDYRGKDLVDYLFLKCRSELYSAGYTTVIAFRMNWNISVQKAMEKLGFYYIGHVKTGYFFTFYYMTNRCKKLTLVRESGLLALYGNLLKK